MMNLSQCQLLKEDDDSYDISYPSGKKFKLDKKGLSTKAHDLIKSLKSRNFADGTVDVAPEAEVVAPSEEDAAPVVPTQTVFPSVNTIMNGPDVSEVPVAQAPAQDAQSRAPASVEEDPLVTSKKDQASLLDREAKDIKAYVGGQQQSAKDQAKIYKDYNESQANALTPEDIVASYKTKDDALMKAYMDKKIDPDRFINNMGTGNKIAAGIGMILSGAGAGVTGGPNLAFNYIKDAINSDIDSQKTEQGKALNQYKANREALGDDLKAQLATQNQAWTGVQAKIAQVIAQHSGSKGALEGQQMLNQIEQQKIQNRMRLGLLTQGQSQPGNPQGLSTSDPTDLVSTLPEAQQAKALEEVAKAKQVAKSGKQMLDLFDQAAQDNTVIRRVGGLRGDPAAITNLQALGQPFIKDEAGRPSEIQQQIFNNLLPQKGDPDAKIAEKRNGFISYLNNQAQGQTFRSALGVDLGHFAQTAPPQLSAPVQTMNGVKYQKVAGGWKRVGG